MADTNGNGEGQVGLLSDPTLTAGRFSSKAVSSLADDHCALTFLAEEPLSSAAQPQAHIVARVYLTIPHMRRLAELLTNQLAERDQESPEASES